MKKKNCYWYTQWLCWAAITLGISFRIYGLLLDHSFWLDEAMLASSVCRRSLTRLIASPLDYGQSAPVGYLYIVKLFAMMLGYSRRALRLLSLIAGIICIGLVYLIAKRICGARHPEWITALFALLPFYIEYSVEFKPYMLDNVCVLLALLAADAYERKQMTLPVLCVFYAVIIWFSFPAVFLVAGHMVVTVLTLLKACIGSKQKNGQERGFFLELGCCALVLFSFYFYYLLWLSGTKEGAGGGSYWDNLAFPLIPKSLDDVRLLAKMATAIFSPLSKMILCMILFVPVGFDLACMCRQRKATPLFMLSIPGILVLFVASWMGFYPIETRLVQFLAILYLLLAAEGLECLCSMLERRGTAVAGGTRWLLYKHSADIISLLLCGVAIACGVLTVSRMRAGKMFHADSDVSKEVAYLKEHFQLGDSVYVFTQTKPVFEYEFGYPADAQQIIYGQSLFAYTHETAYSYNEAVRNETAFREDVKSIEDAESVYLFFSHGSNVCNTREDMLRDLATAGTVTPIYEKGTIYLYHFQRS